MAKRFDGKWYEHYETINYYGNSEKKISDHLNDLRRHYYVRTVEIKYRNVPTGLKVYTRPKKETKEHDQFWETHGHFQVHNKPSKWLWWDDPEYVNRR